ncbi:uncharacterized protein LOC103513391 [Diaphorina citri]|uniref:Uncharacterized protein LOC103513391 n=1 Tax=Diaphorina citri TaxID=121845 RepID=A0A1S4EGV0_DIACI|nr:uncharacterized protein LOC103513391 [Diaphorina citri]
MSVYHIQSLKDLDRLLTTYKDATLAINFYTEWSAQSKIISKEFECLSRNPVCDPLVFAHCHTEIHSDISQRYNVDKVPTLLFIKKGKVVDRLDGFEPKYLQKKLLHHGAKQYQCTYHLNVSPSDLCTRMNTLLNCTEMILFVKCFYSAISWEFYALLDSMCVPYEVFNVSYDMAVSFGAESPALSDRREFPLFFRTMAPAASHIPATIAFLSYHNWKAVIALSQNLDLYSLARVYLLSAGFSLAFGSMFTKTYRVHRIFLRTASGIVKNKLLQDTQLICVICVLLLIDGLIVTVWLSVDPMQRQLRNLTREISSTDRSVVYQPQVEVCGSQFTSCSMRFIANCQAIIY